MPKAIRLNKTNVLPIIDVAKLLEFDLSYLVYNMEDNLSDFGWETILITDGSPKLGNLTFTAMSEPGFFEYWKFTPEELPNQFVDIERC